MQNYQNFKIMEEITSAVVKKIRALEPIVYRCLIKVPATRDDDKLLVLKIWAYQNPKLREKNFSFVDFSEGYLDGLYADSETITRTRRRVQQNVVPSLTGWPALLPETNGRVDDTDLLFFPERR